MEIPKFLLEYLDHCNDQAKSCSTIQLVAIFLAFVIIIMLIVAYYHIQSMGGLSVLEAKGVSAITNQLNRFDTSPNFESFDGASGSSGFDAPPPMTDLPVVSGGADVLTPVGYEGCYQACDCADDKVNFSDDELLDVSLINQKISDYDVVNDPSEFVPGNSAYMHENFMANEGFDTGVVDSHKSWANDIRGKTLSLTALVADFDPEEAMQGVGIRRSALNARVPPSYGIIASDTTLYSSNDNPAVKM